MQAEISEEPDNTAAPVPRRPGLSLALTAALYVAITSWMTRWATWAFRLAHGHQKDGSVSVSDWDWVRVGSKALYGRGVFQGGPLHIYAGIRQLQVGPPALIINGAFQSLLSPETGKAGDIAVLALMIAIGLGLIALIDYRARRRLGALRGGILTALGASVLAPAWGFGFGGWGHLEDSIGIASIVVIGLLVTSDRPRPMLAGLIAGVAIAGKPWAVIFLPVMLVMPKTRDWFRGMTVALITGALFWLPFFAADRQSTNIFKFRWWIQAESALHALGYRSGMYAPSWIRPAQFVLGILVVGYVSRRSWSYALLAGMAARFLVDPAAWPYYSIGPVAMAMLVDAEDRSTTFPVVTAVTVSVFYCPMFFETGTDWIRLGWCVGVLVWTGRAAYMAWRTPSQADSAEIAIAS